MEGKKRFVLKRDLSCPDTEPRALTLVGPATLDMKGNTLSWDEADATGVAIAGTGATLRNGVIKNCIAGVRTVDDPEENGGFHHVEGIVSTHNRDGFFADFGNNNTWLKNSTIENEGEGLDIDTSRNTLKENTAVGNGTVGFELEVDANENLLKENVAKHNGTFGFFIGRKPEPIRRTSDDNELIKNQALFNKTADGFFVDGDRNVLLENISKFNGDDDIDDGFDIRGSDNVLKHNYAAGNYDDGIDFNYDDDDDEPNFTGNQVFFNTSIKNKDNGIDLGERVIENTVKFNVASNNGEFDLVDENPECDDNVWKFNLFKTSESDGVENPECIE